MRMVLVVLPLVDTANAGHCEKDVSLREVEQGVLAGAEPHCRRRHLVEHRLELAGTNDRAKHTADRILLCPQPFVAPGERLDVVNLRSAHERTLRPTPFDEGHYVGGTG
jgi:hypothetical protein